MKNTRLWLCKVWSHLPADLWREILSRLPVKSLLRFRCVSKPWLSLIDNAEFARLHLNNFKNNRDETNLFVVQGTQRDCAVRCSDTFEINSETLHTLGKKDHGWVIVGCVDGLVLLGIHTRSHLSSVLKVWNPSIRKFREFPSFPEFDTSPAVFLYDIDIGLGYDPLAKDYKYVKLIFGNSKTLPSVAIYSLGGGSWKTIEFQCKGSSCPNWDWEPRYFNRRKVYFQGSLYLAIRNSLFWDLVSFDLSSEVFSSISMPDDYKGWWELVLIDGGCSLAMVDTMSVNKFVWVLERSSGGSEAMYWTKRACSFPWRVDRFLYLKKNGDILTMGRRIEALGKNKYDMWEQVASYSPETDEYEILEERRGLYMISHVCGYVESLILHK